MARPRRSTRDSRALILRAAATEFAERGYEAAGVDRIAARARLNKAMLYYHFGSKQGLYLEILRDMFRAVGTRAHAIVDGPGSATEKLDLWIATVVEEADARPWFPPIMLRELASAAAHVDPDTFKMMNGVFASIRALIAQGQREGAFRRDVDPLFAHLTILPAILIFFARQRLLAAHKGTHGVFAPRQVDDFVRHMQTSARGMLRRVS